METQVNETIKWLKQDPSKESKKLIAMLSLK